MLLEIYSLEVGRDDLFAVPCVLAILCSSLCPRHSLQFSQFTYSLDTESLNNNQPHDVGHFIFFDIEPIFPISLKVFPVE